MEDEDTDRGYIPGIYVKSGWEHPITNKEVEERLDNFEGELRNLNKANRKYMGSNLTHTQQRTCDNIQSNKNYKAWASDKNIGTVFIGTTQYTHRGMTSHLGDERTYKSLMVHKANVCMIRRRYTHQGFLMKYYDALSKAETTLLHRSLWKYEKKIARFYLTTKIHKTP